MHNIVQEVRKLDAVNKFIFSVYPILLIIFIPALFIGNTIWNLKSFNRDLNLILRHQAISITETIAPLVIDERYDVTKLQQILVALDQSNQDITAIQILTLDGTPYASSQQTPQKKHQPVALTKMAAGLDQSFAGLEYDAELKRNVWSVVTPIGTSETERFLVYVRLDTQLASTVLARTSQDSFLIMIGVVVGIFILLANHMYFYLRTLKAKHFEELNRMKTEFVSMTAHELRTPTTVINGYLSLLQTKLNSSDPTIIKYFAMLNATAQDLNAIINDLLDVSKIEENKIKIEVEDVSITDMISETVLKMTPLADEKKLAIRFMPSELPVFKSDPARIRQILTNLMSNGIKYSLKGEITVKAVRKDTEVAITVQDTGIGIPPEHMRKLFTKFHRVKDKQSTQVHGTGLGLWITKRMVELLGGTIAVESLYGTGTSITFTLPLTR